MPKKLIVKQYESETKAVENERSLTVTISTNAVDRSGDVVEPNGGKFVNFKKNPVVLMAHDYSGLPIGKASDLKKTDKGITAKVTFPEEGTYPLADTVYNMYKQKFMRAWSIGFIPTKSEEIKDEEGKKNITGYRFLNWELLEFSACSVPANPEALTNMVSKGIDIGLLQEEGLIEIVEGVDIEKVEEKAKYDCECIDCGYKMTSDKHCKEIKCPECGGTMRRVERPGPGEDSKDVKDVIDDHVKDVKVEPIDPDKVKASIEKDEKEVTLDIKEVFPNLEFDKDSDKFTIDGDELIDKIYELAKENKELKEKLEAVEIKAGAVLNAKNKSNLKNAQNLIQSVLDSAGTTEGNSLAVDDNNKNDKGDDDGIDIVTDTVDNPVIDEEDNEAREELEFKANIEAIVNQSATDNRKYFKDKLDYALGRVSK